MRIVWMPKWNYEKLLKAGWNGKYAIMHTWRYVPVVVMFPSRFKDLR